ncbi:MAG: hypothetical protein ACJ8HI_07310 [Massilia sp.]|jgi:hypothetical protein
MGSQALDQAARQMGFHDYATYQAYQNKQAAMRMDNGIQGTGYSTGPQQAAAPPENWLQHLLSSIPIHPAYLLGKVNDAFTKAGQ